MKFYSLICGLALLASSVSALVVTGVPGATGTRYEVRELQAKYPRQFTLFLLAMKQYQAISQSTETGYYQIAGIHGVPRVDFDGVAQCANCAGTDGYCTHDSILFLAWHRAYLALFEQELVSIAKNIASQYPTSTRSAYVAAASALRLPYWDWAAHPPNGGNTLPNLITAASVTVPGPAGSSTIPNPLLKHTFSTPANLHYTPFTSWQSTLRYPSSNAASATSNEAKDTAAFNNIRGSLQDRLYQIFTTCTTYEMVGLDTKGTSTPSCANSLEGLHNTIHTTSGGPAIKGPPKISGGHMTYLSTAAFDPIFWLHHCNVDRLFAMWQAIYPNSYGGTQTGVKVPTWTIPKGASVNADSPLTPFHSNSAGAFWTTNSVKSTKTFNYNYPEFVDSDGSTAAIKSYVNKLYGPSATATAGSSKRTAIPEAELAALLAEPRSLLSSTPLKASNGSLFQYVANIQTGRFALAGSYNIFLFDGNPSSEDPAEFLLDPNLIGPMGVLASSMSGVDVVISGSIPLTRSLTDAVSAGSLTDLTEASVVPYLVKNLQWRIVGPDGGEVDPSSVSDFDVSVYASTASPITADEFPVWSEFISLEDVTKDRLNGTSSTNSTISSATAPISKITASATATKGVKSKVTSLLSTVTPTGTSLSVRRRRSARV